MDADQTFKNNDPKMISTGLGRTTCSYFLPDNEHILYASTHEDSENCPEVPLRKEGKYVWPIYDSFDIYVSDLNGKIITNLLIKLVMMQKQLFHQSEIKSFLHQQEMVI